MSKHKVKKKSKTKTATIGPYTVPLSVKKELVAIAKKWKENGTLKGKSWQGRAPLKIAIAKIIDDAYARIFKKTRSVWTKGRGLLHVVKSKPVKLRPEQTEEAPEVKTEEISGSTNPSVWKPSDEAEDLPTVGSGAVTQPERVYPLHDSVYEHTGSSIWKPKGTDADTDYFTALVGRRDG